MGLTVSGPLTASVCEKWADIFNIKVTHFHLCTAGSNRQYLPFAFCSFNLLVQVPAHRHQHHGIIWCMLQNKSVCSINISFTDTIKFIDLYRELSKMGGIKPLKSNSHHSWIQKCHLNTRLNCTICLPSGWWGFLRGLPGSSVLTRGYNCRIGHRDNDFLLQPASEQLRVHK